MGLIIIINSMALLSLLLLLALVPAQVSSVHGPSYEFALPVLQLDISTPSTLPVIQLPHINQNDGSFMISLYLRVNSVPLPGSGNSLELFAQNSGFSVCVFGSNGDCVQNQAPQVLFPDYWLYLSL